MSMTTTESKRMTETIFAPDLEGEWVICADDDLAYHRDDIDETIFRMVGW